MRGNLSLRSERFFDNARTRSISRRHTKELGLQSSPIPEYVPSAFIFSFSSQPTYSGQTASAATCTSAPYSVLLPICWWMAQRKYFHFHLIYRYNHGSGPIWRNKSVSKPETRI
ncbi:hypothetical protein B0H19DRAFT_431293 [Mycena capillaripes]|nr:hypothetical protein B0H19DRAFT_431293 [Mycena capillaripes]